MIIFCGGALHKSENIQCEPNILTFLCNNNNSCPKSEDYASEYISATPPRMAVLSLEL